MNSISIKSNAIHYVGSFREPALAMWGNGRLIMSGLYQSLRDYDVGLNNIRTPVAAEFAGEQTVIAEIRGTRLHFYFDRIELHATNFDTAQWELMLPIVQSVAEWIEDVAPDSEIRRHEGSYVAHGTVEREGQPIALPTLATSPRWLRGESLGAGAILNYSVKHEEYEGRVRFIIDRSRQIEGGLFLSFESELTGLLGKPAKAMASCKDFLAEMLANYDFELQR